MSLARIAHELYGLLPTEFIAERDAAARAIRPSDRSLSDEVKALRKPSTAAWAVNLLSREKSDLLEQVLALGVSLRQAQAGLQGEELRALTKQRRQLIAAVTTEVRSLAAAAGVKLTEAVARQVEDTLSAAMVDEGAAAAVHSGMLTDALASTGMGSLSLGSVVGVIPGKTSGKLHAVPPAPVDASEERERVEKLLEQASALLDDAEARVEKAAKKKNKREAKTLQLQAELDELRRKAAELEHALDGLADELEEAEEAYATAVAMRDEAKAAAVDAAKLVAKTSR
ncbi:MAG TPA: hypothetical protein VFK41_07855 [Nocardioidaceae bacterium]|nr:hypothetical protein [Nocardioidaceae bacterium]